MFVCSVCKKRPYTYTYTCTYTYTYAGVLYGQSQMSQPAGFGYQIFPPTPSLRSYEYFI